MRRICKLFWAAIAVLVSVFFMSCEQLLQRDITFSQLVVKHNLSVQ